MVIHVDRTVRQARTVTVAWAAIAEITLAGTICLWWECDPMGVTSQYGRGGPTTVLAAAMAATIVGALLAAQQLRYHRLLRLAISFAVAVAAAGPGCLALSGLLSPKPTGTYLLLAQATIGMGVVAASGIRTGSTANRPADSASRPCSDDNESHLPMPDGSRRPAEHHSTTDQPITRAE